MQTDQGTPPLPRRIVLLKKSYFRHIHLLVGSQQTPRSKWQTGEEEMNELPRDNGHISILFNSETRKQETSFNQGFFHFHFVSVFNLFIFIFSDTAYFIILKLFIRVQSTY